MRHIKYITFLFIGIATLLTSCKRDFLTVTPESNLTTVNFYKTESDFKLALVGLYTPLRDIASVAHFMDEGRSDNAHYDYYAPDRGNAQIESLIDFMDVPSNPLLQTRYQSAYAGISRANTILSRLELVPATTLFTDSAKNVIIGEAKAMRAHYYFDLVRNFGGVPLYLQETTTPGQSYLPRNTAEEVYTQIIKDFTEAMPYLQAPNFAAGLGRMNKGAASTELAAVYLQRKEYTKAIPLLESVKTMGYALQANFRDIFDPTKKNNKELIFEVQYKSGSDGQSSNFIYRFIPKMTNTTVVLGVKFNNTIGGWNVPTDELLNTFEASDKRLDATVGIVEGTEDASSNFTAEKVVSIIGYVQPTGKIGKRFAKKYYYPNYPNLNQNTDQNWPLYRYADVLLMLAECYNEANTGNPLIPLNEVRARAGVAPVAATSQSDLRGIIAKERRSELGLENKRWQDLIRTDSAIAVMNAYGVTTKAKYGYILPQAYNVTKERLVYPIPSRERQYNPALIQNPGYE